jgi:glyoxylase-like metal-dependent hydrolase (beta-lactamase superfamily II)
MHPSGLQVAPRAEPLRLLALHEDVLVAVSAIWQTTCTLVRSGTEAFCVDSPVLPAELEALPAVAEQAGFPVVGLLATHGDWDHLLGRLAFPHAALGVAESTAQRLRAEPGAAQRGLRDFDDEHYVDRGPLSLGDVQPLPVPGHCALGDSAELELHDGTGHTADGMAILVPWASVLIAGDYLSPVEIPTVGDRDAYLATLDRLEPLVERADHVVPGHGEPLDAERALAILREDRAYLQALPDAQLPIGRRGAAQKKIHAVNVRAL